MTDGLTDEECELLSFARARTMDEALSMAFRSQGRSAKVGLIPYGGETLVRVGGKVA